MNNYYYKYLGAWRSEDAWTTAVYEIKITKNKIIIKGFDVSDCEEFIISRVQCEDLRISFESYLPSTDHRAKHVLKYISKSKIRDELTVVERWKKIGVVDNKSTRKHKSISDRNNRWLTGDWAVEDDDTDTIISICTAGRRTKVSAWHKETKEAFRVSKVRWTGSKLAFECSNEISWVRYQLKPVSDNVAVGSITFLNEYLLKVYIH